MSEEVEPTEGGAEPMGGGVEPTGEEVAPVADEVGHDWPPHKGPRGTHVVCWSVSLLVLLVFVVAGLQLKNYYRSTDSSILRALRKEPIATFVPRGVVSSPFNLVSDGGTEMNEPEPAQITREWMLRTGDAARAWTQMLRLARQGGWRLRVDDGVDLQTTPRPKGLIERVAIGENYPLVHGVRPANSDSLDIELSTREQYDEPGSGKIRPGYLFLSIDLRKY